MPYAHPEALVSTEWLAARLDDPQIRIVDSSFKLPGITPTAREDYDRGHIPGAVFFDIDDIAQPGTTLPHMIPSPELFARKMEALGIGDGDRVVVYDSAGLSSAGRAWWMLRLFGHGDVALLDGGLPKWKAEGRPVGTMAPSPRERRFTPRFDPSLVREKRALLDNLSTGREQVVDARASGRFEGTAEETRPGLRRGHIPGSRSLPYDRVTDPQDLSAARRRGAGSTVPRRRGRSRPADRYELRVGRHRLRARLCAASDRAPGAAVYDGSWSEWGLPGDTPVETGPAPPRPSS